MGLPGPPSLFCTACCGPRGWPVPTWLRVSTPQCSEDECQYVLHFRNKERGPWSGNGGHSCPEVLPGGPVDPREGQWSVTRQAAHGQVLVTTVAQGQASSPASHVLGDPGHAARFSEPQFPQWKVGARHSAPALWEVTPSAPCSNTPPGLGRAHGGNPSGAPPRRKEITRAQRLAWFARPVGAVII